MNEIEIKIIHYKDLNKYQVYLAHNMKLFCCIAEARAEDYLDMCEKLNGLSIRLGQLGNTVNIVTEEKYFIKNTEDEDGDATC